MYQTAYHNQEYRKQEVISASPVHLVVMAYDLAIRACEREDFALAVKAITALRDALDFDYGEAALGLFKIYQWCLDCLRQQNFSETLRTLHELRNAWASVEKQTAPVIPASPQINATASRFQISG